MRRQTGNEAEQAAAAHLRASGLRILAEQWKLEGGRGGELDLVAFDPRAKLLVFVEVKSRRTVGAAAAEAIVAITPAKRRKIEHTASVYAYANRAMREVAGAAAIRFDAVGVAVRPDGTFEIAWIPDAWRAGD